jgi:hypothetical protein
MAALGALVDATAGRERPPGFFVVLALQANLPSERKLAAFAEAFKLDIFSARQWLLSPTPRLIRRESRQAVAIEWVEWLKAVGVRAYELPEQLLLEQVWRPQAAVFSEPEGLVFDEASGFRTRIPRRDVVALVFGEVTERDVVEKSATSLMGERDLGSTPGRNHSQLILDIHRRDSPEVIRLAQDGIHWSLMYPDETGQSTMLMRRLLKRLRGELTGVRLFEDFGLAAPLLGTSRQLIDCSSEARKTVIGAASGMRVERTRTYLESELGAFNLYSTLLRWEVLRIGALPG